MDSVPVAQPEARQTLVTDKHATFFANCYHRNGLQNENKYEVTVPIIGP